MCSNKGGDKARLRAQAAAVRGHDGLSVPMLGLCTWVLPQRKTIRLQRLIVMPPRKFSLSSGCAFQSFRSISRGNEASASCLICVVTLQPS